MLIFLSKAKSTHYVFSTICYSNSIYICVLIRRKYFNGWWVSWYNIFLYILNSFFSLRGFFGWFFFVKINIVSSTYVLNILRILNDNMESTQSLIASNVIHYVQTFRIYWKKSLIYRFVIHMHIHQGHQYSQKWKNSHDVANIQIMIAHLDELI